MSNESRETLRRMETMLRRCRRRIVMANVSVRLRKGLEVYLMCLLGIAGAFLVLRLLGRAVETPIVLEWMHVLAVAAVFGVMVLGSALLRGVLGKPVGFTNAAERLDLSQSTHNRIATAIALLRRGDDSQFAEAAIDDGCEHLERLRAERPHVELATTSWCRKAAYLAVSLAMVFVGQSLEAELRSPGDGDPNTPGVTTIAELGPESDAVTPDIEVERKPRVPTPQEARPPSEMPAEEDDADDDNEDKRPEPGTESRSEGPVGQHASGNSRSSQSSSDSRSAASGTGAKSEPGSTEPGKPKKPREAKKPATGPPKLDRENKKSGSINARGSSGTGSMRTAQNEWSSKVKAKSDDSDDFEQEEEPDEEMDPDKQRLGAQPALKNRTSRVSRELSLSMGMDLSKDMMKGRGGPSAQKKSRGTASMIMGVPVPGFVKGRLLPGPTKSTQEEVEPSPRQGDYAVASNLRQARPEEDSQERYRPSAALVVQARDYLIQYHAENENKRNGDATDE